MALSATFVSISDEISEGRAPPRPAVVVDNVGRVGDVRSVVSVELARLVSSAVVVRLPISVL